MTTKEYNFNKIGRIEYNGNALKHLEINSSVQFHGDNFFYKVRTGNTGRISWKDRPMGPSSYCKMHLVVYDEDFKEVFNRHVYRQTKRTGYFYWCTLDKLTDYYVKIRFYPRYKSEEGQIYLEHISLLGNRWDQVGHGGDYRKLTRDHLYVKEFYNFPSTMPVKGIPHLFGYWTEHTCSMIPKNGPVGLTSMSTAFEGYRGDLKNWDFSKWDTSNLVSMYRAFRSTAGAWGSAGETIRNWDVSKVKSFAEAFHWSTFNANLGNWKPTSQHQNYNWTYTDLRYMFANNFSNTKCDLRNWCFKGLSDSDARVLDAFSFAFRAPFFTDSRKRPNFSCK